MELDLVADALGGEVGDDLGQVEGWRARVGRGWRSRWSKDEKYAL